MSFTYFAFREADRLTTAQYYPFLYLGVCKAIKLPNMEQTARIVIGGQSRIADQIASVPIFGGLGNGRGSDMAHAAP